MKNNMKNNISAAQELINYLTDDNTIDYSSMRDFLVESNAIEGIRTEPSRNQINYVLDLLRKDIITLDDVCDIVRLFQPNARLRDSAKDCVKVGRHTPPAGGMNIVYELEELIKSMNSVRTVADRRTADMVNHELHIRYEKLHPFTDCNGRSGRVLWLWCRGCNKSNLSFLHKWYYDSLSYSRIL